MEITQEKLNAWYEHKSNKETWCENQERLSDQHINECNGCALCQE